MRKDWLQARLTPAKKRTSRWRELAEALERFFEEHFYPELDRLGNQRSIFRAEEGDLNRRIKELGEFFAFDLPTGHNKRIALAWRRQEVLYKDRAELFELAFKRHFHNLRTEWQPLYAPLGQEYGGEFLTAETIKAKGLSQGDYFLTSRGKVATDLGHLHSLGLTKDNFHRRAMELMDLIRPTDIVYAGEILYREMHVFFSEPAGSGQAKAANLIRLSVSLTGRFDEIPADLRKLDRPDFGFSGRRENKLLLAVGECGLAGGGWRDRQLGRLDTIACFDGVPADFMPLDMFMEVRSA